MTAMQPIAAEIMPLQSNWRCRLCGLIKNADSLLILGNIFYLRRNYEKALEWYRKMQKVAPGDVSLKINIANTFHAMRNYAEARRYAQEVLKTDSQNVSALTALAYAFLKKTIMRIPFPFFSRRCNSILLIFGFTIIWGRPTRKAVTTCVE